MYSLIFFENGRSVTQIGGPIATLSEVKAQLDTLGRGLPAQDMPDYLGIQWYRSGATPCAIVVMDRWNLPIKIEEDE